MLFKTARNRSNLGFNLVELAIVLGIVGLIVGAIYVAWASVRMDNNVNQARNLITTTLDQLRAMYATRVTAETSAAPDFTAALIRANIVPKNLISSNGYILNPWGGDLTVESRTNSFRFTMTNIEGQEGCKKLANSIFNAMHTNGLYNYKYNGADITLTPATQYAAVDPQLCKTTAAKQTLTMDFLVKQ